MSSRIKDERLNELLNLLGYVCTKTMLCLSFNLHILMMEENMHACMQLVYVYYFVHVKNIYVTNLGL